MDGKLEGSKCKRVEMVERGNERAVDVTEDTAQSTLR